MAYFDEKQLKQHMKAGALLPVYLLIGDESYLKSHYETLLADAAVDPAFASMNIDRFDGKNLDLQDVFDRAATLPMLGEKRCVIVEDCKLDPMNEKAFAAFSASLRALPDTTVLIFRQEQNKISKKTGKKLLSLFEECGAVCELEKRKGQSLYQPLIAAAKKRGCVLSQQNAEYLVSCVGNDFNVLIQELSKVCSYANGEITRAHIDTMAVKTLDARVYDLTRALFRHRFSEAHDVLRTLLALKTEPNYIFGAIVGTFVDLYRVKVALSCTGKTAALTEIFNYKGREFSLNYTARDAASLSLEQIRACLRALQKADSKLKTSAQSGELILEELMVRLLLIMNGEAPC